MLMLRPSIQPRSRSPCSNAATRRRASGSLAAIAINTPRRRMIRSVRCARAASGHSSGAAAAPANKLTNSRRFIALPRRRGAPAAHSTTSLAMASRVRRRFWAGRASSLMCLRPCRPKDNTPRYDRHAPIRATGVAVLGARALRDRQWLTHSLCNFPRKLRAHPLYEAAAPSSRNQPRHRAKGHGHDDDCGGGEVDHFRQAIVIILRPEVPATDLPAFDASLARAARERGRIERVRASGMTVHETNDGHGEARSARRSVRTQARQIGALGNHFSLPWARNGMVDAVLGDRVCRRIGGHVLGTNLKCSEFSLRTAAAAQPYQRPPYP